MTRYLEIKPGSVSEVSIRLRDDYQAFFKKELEKAGKGIAQMTDAEKKAFFNRVDKEYNAKNETAQPTTKKPEDSKTTMVVKPGAPKGQESVIRIPKEKLADYKSKGYIEAESFVPEAKQVDELTAGQKKLPPALQKAIKAKEKSEAVDNPYAVGMAAAMKQTGDKPPLKKSTIVKAHDIAKSIKKNEEVKLEAVDLKLLKPGNYITVKSKEYVIDKIDGEIVKASDEDGDFKFFKIKDIDKIENAGFVSFAAEFKPEDKVHKYHPALDEGFYKDIDVRKSDLKLAKDKRQNLKDKYNAIMAGQAEGDEGSIQDQIQKLDMSIKKQEQELIDKMKMMKKEAVDPERIANLQQRIQKMSADMNKLDVADPKSKTKAAIYKSDINTAQLRLKDLIQKKTGELNKQVKETKMGYKSFKQSLKKEQDKKDPKKTMTGQPMTKVDVDPKLGQM